MKASRLVLGNFRCFPELALDLAACTVIIGPNDSGKSTVVEALRFVLSDADKTGEAWNRGSLSTTVDFFESMELWDDRPVTAIIELNDLSAVEASLWGPLVNEGVLRIGAYLPRWADVPDAGDARRVGPCVVVRESESAQCQAFLELGDDSVLMAHAGDVWVGLPFPQSVLGADAGRRPTRDDLPSLVAIPGQRSRPRQSTMSCDRYTSA